MRKYLLSLCLMTSILLASTLNVAVAANMGYAIKDLQKTFQQQHPHIKLRITLGSSGKLATQIHHGAPYHIFLSANTLFAQVLYDSGKALEKPKLYAQGLLVLFSSKKRALSQGMKLLSDPEIKKVVIANPKTAPYGQAAVEALQNSGLYTHVKDKLIYSESISQAVSYARLAADMGFIAKSALFTPKMRSFKEGIHWVDVSKELYSPIKQSMVLLKKAQKSSEAKAFYDFLLGPEAQKIFLSYGYKGHNVKS